VDTTPPARRHTMRRTVGACLAAAIAACLALVAFASAQGGSGTEQSITITARAGGATVTGAESLRPGPAQVTLRVAGGQDQNVLLIRLKPGVDEDDVVRFTRRRADSVPVDLVSLETSEFLSPGGTYRTAITLVPGRYLAVGEGNRTPALGRYAAFDVGGAPTGGSLPRADSVIQMYDYGFRIPKRIDGDGPLRVDNIGRNEHFIVGIRLNPGVNPAVVRRQLIAGVDFQGPPPGEFASIIGVVSPGTVNVIQTDLKPGVYLLACFYSDRASAGHEHSGFGMVRQMTVR
jgi:hypothetical protein